MSRYDTALKYFNEQKELTDVRVKSGIELYRKGDVKITVKDKDGNPVKGAKVFVSLKNHEFRFGANVFMLDEFECEEKNKAYREDFAKLFNIATIPFYWSDLEPERGKPRYAKDSPKIYRRPATDLCVEYCLENGIEPKCHCLNYDNFTPDWAKGVTVDEQKRMLTERFRSLSEKYADIIPTWEVTNETLQGFNAPRTKFYFQDDFVDWSFRMADKFFPNNRLIINDYYIWEVGQFMNSRSAYYMQIEKLMRDGITHLDSIGMQYHSFFPLDKEPDLAKTRYNPKHLYNVLDRYAMLGKKLQITEMTIPAYSANTEDEDIQAELLCNFYKVCFSHPAMEAIIYWNLVDGYAAFAPQGDMTSGENIYHGGLVRFDMTKKAGYHALYNLIHKEWHTELETGTDDGGMAGFRGFYGDYEIKVIADGKEYTEAVLVSEKKNNSFTITL
ncbi:MAG: endo-1,4-beta-xylanase [Clostridia bacterium]|nr:endo-1,4-beta-xylanase [Clostridia bacterium]